MIGKITSPNGKEIVFCPVVKTSNSGISSNPRLVVLSLNDALMGYLSKIPESLHQFTDTNCIAKCKEIINLRSVPPPNYIVSYKQPNTLSVFWKTDKQKSWEFKFQSAEAANQWSNYMSKSIKPPPDPQESSLNPIGQKIGHQQNKENANGQPEEANTGLAQRQDTKSRFKQIQKQKEREQENQSIPQPPPHSPSSTTNKGRNFLNRENRFEKYQQNSMGWQLNEQDRLPAISTFKQKYSSQTKIDNNFTINSQPQSQHQNWNLRWFEIIQKQSSQNSIDFYQQFVNHCKQTCINIVQQLPSLKKDRKFIPVKQQINQQIYEANRISYKLLLPNQLKFSISKENQYILKETKQELENFKFILKATLNKGPIWVPLVCIVKYLGFTFLCQASLPSNYKQIDQSSIGIFRKYIKKIQEKINLRVIQSQLTLFTSRPQGFQLNPGNGDYIIACNIKNLLPKLKIPNSFHSFWLPAETFLHPASPTLQQLEKKDFNLELQRHILQFEKHQSQACSIISVEDLIKNLKKHQLTQQLKHLLIKKCNNKYLNSIYISEIIAEKVELLTWLTVNQLVASETVPSKSTDLLLSTISHVILGFLAKKGESWRQITSSIFEEHQIVIRHKDIILGYLFSSIGLKLGIQLDYQFLLELKQTLTNCTDSIPIDAILDYSAVALTYSPQQISQNHAFVCSNLKEPHPSESVFQQIVDFYNLRGQPLIETNTYQWRQISQLLSSFIPFEKEEDFSHLHIYEQEEPEHLDFPIYATIRSAIKWLLLDKKLEKALHIISRFKEDSWFWVGEPNFFVIQLQQLIGSYYAQKGKPAQALTYFKSVSTDKGLLFSQGAQAFCCDNDLQLAKILKRCGKHRESLEKFKQVHHQMKKQSKSSQMLLFIMIEIASLYLHLGSIDKCLYYAKQAIDYSTFYAFSNEEQEIAPYLLILRCLQIQDESSKFKFYIDIIQDKFGKTQNAAILHQVLKGTISQLVLTMPPYEMKKLAYFMYCFEKRLESEADHESLEDLFTQILKLARSESPPKLLRFYIQKCSEITDQLTLLESQRGSKNSERKEQILQFQKRLQILLKFVGPQYVLGKLTERLNQKN